MNNDVHTCPVQLVKMFDTRMRFRFLTIPDICRRCLIRFRGVYVFVDKSQPYNLYAVFPVFVFFLDSDQILLPTRLVRGKLTIYRVPN